jgi:hypothetical protein
VQIEAEAEIIIFIVFLVLKLTHVINWSWWYVTMPLYAPYIIALAIISVGFSIYGIVCFINKFIIFFLKLKRGEK